MPEENWERRVIEQLATEGLLEQQRARRWGIFFKLLTFALLFIVLYAALASWMGTDRVCLDKCTAMVEIQGEIDADGRASAENVIAGLQAAFKNKGTQGVVLKIDSPGGSPVQAGAINDEIRRLRGKYPDTPIYVNRSARWARCGRRASGCGCHHARTPMLIRPGNSRLWARAGAGEEYSRW